MIKKIIGWWLSQVLYSFGDVVSHVMNWNEPPARLYGLYSWFMAKSMAAQDWGGAGQWRVVGKLYGGDDER